MAIALDDDFPRAYAATDRFRRGLPRSFEVTDTHVTFLRATGPQDAQLSLWRLDLASAREQLLVDAASLHAGDADLPDAERARRERLRESGAGITGFSQSSKGDRIVFATGGTLWCWDALGLRALETEGPVFDPRIDPSGELVAGVIAGAVHVLRFVDGELLAAVERPGRTVGMADFAAAEELGRQRGHWWSPAGDLLLAEVVDESPVPLWRIADPTYPDREPREHRYPHAGAANAGCALVAIDVAAGTETEIGWDSTVHEYLVSVHWSTAGAPLVTLANREQTRFETLALDPRSGGLTSVHVAAAEPWLDVIPGVPAWLPDGRLVHALDDTGADAHRICFDGVPVTPPDFQASGVEAVGAHGVVVSGWFDPRCATALHIDADGSVTRLSDGFTHALFASNGSVHVRTTLFGDRDGRAFEVLRDGQVIATIASHAEHALMPVPQFLTLGAQRFNAVILWPQQPHPEPLPIILSPYGGPHHLEVVAAAGSFAPDQWLADQGFAVIVADGRGTPGRGLAWEHAIADRFAEVTLADQVEALDAALALYPERLDATRVGIRGWSYGGYLSALAMLARPDRFHVAVAGAPVTEWALYDTAYTERYLGHPDKAPEVYRENSLCRLAANLQGRLMIVHGLADDNVVAAHSLQLSGALLAAGRMHDFLPLAGVSHMTPQATVTENLLRIEARYFTEHLRAARG